MKSSYDDVRAVVDDIFDQWNPSTATPMEEVSGSQGDWWECTFLSSKCILSPGGSENEVLIDR